VDFGSSRAGSRTSRPPAERGLIRVQLIIAGASA
jgi:hypothetical protein